MFTGFWSQLTSNFFRIVILKASFIVTHFFFILTESEGEIRFEWATVLFLDRFFTVLDFRRHQFFSSLVLVSIKLIPVKIDISLIQNYIHLFATKTFKLYSHLLSQSITHLSTHSMSTVLAFFFVEVVLPTCCCSYNCTNSSIQFQMVLIFWRRKGSNNLDYSKV